jgi:hypothetical protein
MACAERPGVAPLTSVDTEEQVEVVATQYRNSYALPTHSSDPSVNC